METKIRKYTDAEISKILTRLEKNNFHFADNLPLDNEPKQLYIGGEPTGLYIGKKGVKISGELDVADGVLQIINDTDGVQHKGVDGTAGDQTPNAIDLLYKQNKTISTKKTPSKNNHLATKEYVDSAGGGDGVSATTFQLEDGDGTEVTIAHEKEVKFVEGENIDINWTDVSTGSDGDPYDLTFGVKIPYVLYSNFQDDLGTSKHYLPLRDVFEQTFPGSEQANTLVPFNMTLQKVVMRSNTNISGATWTLGMFTVDSGSNDAHHHTTGRNWVTATGGVAYTNAIFDFTGTVGDGSSSSGGSNAVTAGQLIDFQLFADTDVTTTSSEFWFSFLFHVDMSNTI